MSDSILSMWSVSMNFIMVTIPKRLSYSPLRPMNDSANAKYLSDSPFCGLKKKLSHTAQLSMSATCVSISGILSSRSIFA